MEELSTYYEKVENKPNPRLISMFPYDIYKNENVLHSPYCIRYTPRVKKGWYIYNSEVMVHPPNFSRFAYPDDFDGYGSWSGGTDRRSKYCCDPEPKGVAPERIYNITYKPSSLYNRKF